MKQEHRNQFTSAMLAIRERDIQRVFLSACGGSLAIMMPVKYILDRECRLPVQLYNARELACLESRMLDEHSLFISCSHQGKTPETLEMTQKAREAGALVVCLSNTVDSPLWKLAEYPIHYDWGFSEDTDVSDTNYGVLLRLAFSLVCMTGDEEQREKFGRAIERLDALTPVLAKSRALYYDHALAFGKTNRRQKVIYTLGSGICYAAAYSFSTCLLMEMLWINSNPINAAEFFHGPFEIVDDDVTFLAVKGVGASRLIDERAISFANRFTQRVHVIDAADFAWGDIEEDLREYLTPAILNGVIRRYADQLADFTGHPLSVRRYMWRMEY